MGKFVFSESRKGGLSGTLEYIFTWCAPQGAIDAAHRAASIGTTLVAVWCPEHFHFWPNVHSEWSFCSIYRTLVGVGEDADSGHRRSLWTTKQPNSTAMDAAWQAQLIGNTIHGLRAPGSAQTHWFVQHWVSWRVLISGSKWSKKSMFWANPSIWEAQRQCQSTQLGELRR